MRRAAHVFGLHSTKLPPVADTDRKSTRLNSSHDQISYAVFCLKKKKRPVMGARVQPVNRSSRPPVRHTPHSPAVSRSALARASRLPIRFAIKASIDRGIETSSREPAP